MSSQYLQDNGAGIYYKLKDSGPYIVFVADGYRSGKLYKPVRFQPTKHFPVVLNYYTNTISKKKGLRSI